MATIHGFYRRVTAFNTTQAAQQAIRDTLPDMLAQNLDQLKAGRLRSGDLITPSYQNDPYFKKPGAGQRYSDWKDEITPDPRRPPGTPNLFVIGVFHGSIQLKQNGAAIEFRSTFIDADRIVAKFGPLIYGLGGEFKVVYISTALRPAWNKYVFLAIGITPKSKAA